MLAWATVGILAWVTVGICVWVTVESDAQKNEGHLRWESNLRANLNGVRTNLRKMRILRTVRIISVQMICLQICFDVFQLCIVSS